MFLEEMLLEISTFLCHFFKKVHSMYILDPRFWLPRNLGFIHLWSFKVCSFWNPDCLLTRYHFFCFHLFDLTFFFCLTLKLPATQGRAFLPKVGTMQLFLAYVAYMASIQGTEKNTYSFRRAPASLIPSWFPLLCAPVMLQNVWEILWAEHKVHHESTVRNYPITVVYPLS